jgi:membrane-associated phospholipid phosphatase
MFKDIFYDWTGYNLKLFSYINKLFNHKLYDIFVLIISEIADVNNIIFIIALITAIYFYIKNNTATLSTELKVWEDSLVTLYFASLFILPFIEILKFAFKLPRPFCLLDSNTVRTIGDMSEHVCHKSFPSGHSAVSGLIVASMWNILNKSLKVLAIIFIPLVWLSRVAIGVHFPVDVITGTVVAIIGVMITRKFITPKATLILSQFKKDRSVSSLLKIMRRNSE